jgi:predicted nucleic acid-binding protein
MKRNIERKFGKMLKVLDAWALLAWVQDEKPAAAKVQKLLDESEAGDIELIINMLNLGEVYYRLVRIQGEHHAEAFLKDFQDMPVMILSVSNALAISVAKLKSRHPISYADAFALATAIRKAAPLVTGDPELKRISNSGVAKIEWISS